MEEIFFVKKETKERITRITKLTTTSQNHHHFHTERPKKMDDSYNNNNNNNKNVDVRSMEIEFVRALNAFVNNFHLPTTTTTEVETWKTGVKPHVYAESLRRQLNALREKTEELYAFEEEEEEKEKEGNKNFNNRTNKKKKLKKKRSTLLAAVFVGAREDEDEDDEDDEHNDEHYQTDKRNHTKKERDDRKFRAYEEKINEIEKKVPAYEHPAFVSATASAIPSSSSSLSSSFSSSSATAALATAAAAKNAAENVDVPVATVTTTTKKKKLYAPKKFTISKEGDELLQNEKKMQENLTDEMVDLASRIKRNAEEVSRELSRSNKLVDSMETKLDQNVVVAKSATQRQTAIFRKNKKYGCWSCIVLTLIFVLFSWVYIVIKFSGDKTVHLIKKMEDRVRYDNKEDDDVVAKYIRVERDEQVSGEAKHSSSGSRDALEL